MSKKIGRSELIAWLNDVIEADYPKIENCSDGIAYCQILDCMFPNQAMHIPLHKLNF